MFILLLTACGNQSPAENQTEQTLPSELETGVTVETNAPAETIDQNLKNLFWEEDPQETTSAETQPKQTEKPDTPAPTTPKQDTDTTKPVKPKPTEPAQTTEPTQAPTEPTKPSGGSGSGNASPEWTPPIL